MTVVIIIIITITMAVLTVATPGDTIYDVLSDVTLFFPLLVLPSTLTLC
jgi:hypothetical protein